MIRRCDSCGTPLQGRKRQGFVKGGKIVCGREEIEKTVTDENGYKFLTKVRTPECRWNKSP